MFDAYPSQASALAALQLQPPTRLLPLLQGSDAALNQALRLRLERGIAALGLPVRSLELAAQRLAPLLAQARPAAAAAKGACAAAARSSGGSVWLWQAELEACAVLLQGSAAQPLLALQATPASLVQAYNAVKVLWQVAQLLPLVLALEPQGTPGTDPAASAAAAAALARVQRSLLRQTEERLGVQPRVWTLGYDRPQTQSAAAAEPSCMRKVLETALVLPACENRPHVDLPVAHPFGAPAALAIRGVPDVYRQRHA